MNKVTIMKNEKPKKDPAVGSYWRDPKSGCVYVLHQITGLYTTVNVETGSYWGRGTAHEAVVGLSPIAPGTKIEIEVGGGE